MISRTIADLPFEAARRYGDRPAPRFRQDGAWRDKSFAELAAEEIVPWARERGLGDDLTALAGHPRVRELVQAVVDEANEQVSRPARIKRFAVLDRDFSVESGELTPTLKIKRSLAYANHAALIEELYASR